MTPLDSVDRPNYPVKYIRSIDRIIRKSDRDSHEPDLQRWPRIYPWLGKSDANAGSSVLGGIFPVPPVQEKSSSDESHRQRQAWSIGRKDAWGFGRRV